MNFLITIFIFGLALVIIIILTAHYWQMRRTLIQINDINQMNAVKNARFTNALIMRAREAALPPSYASIASPGTALMSVESAERVSTAAPSSLNKKKKKGDGQEEHHLLLSAAEAGLPF